MKSTNKIEFLTMMPANAIMPIMLVAVKGAPIKACPGITPINVKGMGAAYAVGLVLIYLLVVAQFGSYLIPLIIMAPIPLTLIGVMPVSYTHLRAHET